MRIDPAACTFMKYHAQPAVRILRAHSTGVSIKKLLEEGGGERDHQRWSDIGAGGIDRA